MITPMSIISAAFSLFVVYNVLGNIPFYIALLQPYTPKRQRIILFREMLIALGILFLFGFCGDCVLSFLGIRESIIGIAGGVLLFLISLTMVFPKHAVEEIPDHEPFLVPIAIPGMAGPGSIAAVMLYSHEIATTWKMFLVIFLAWTPSLLIVLTASFIKSLIGSKGLIAVERLGGLLLSLIAVQMIVQGIMGSVQEYFPKSIAIKKVHEQTHAKPAMASLSLENILLNS